MTRLRVSDRIENARKIWNQCKPTALNSRIAFSPRNSIPIHSLIVAISRISPRPIGNTCRHSKAFLCLKKCFVLLKLYSWVEMQIWFLHSKTYTIRLHTSCMCNSNILEFGTTFNFSINRTWFVWIMCNYCLFPCIFVCVTIYNLSHIWHLYERRKGELFSAL